MKTEKLKKLFVCIFDLWKTFPDAVKTTVLVSLVTAIAVFWTGNQSPQPPPQVQIPPPHVELTNLPVKNPHSPLSPVKRKSLSRLQASSWAMPETSGTAPKPSEAQDMLGRGSYAASYRQAVEVVRTLPEKERQRIAPQAQAAARSYARGDFREAAYQMQAITSSQ